MTRILSLLYGTISYVMFLGVMLYAVCFVGNIYVPKSIDFGRADPFEWSLLINLGLLALFAVQHSVMARPGFKKVWTKLVPRHLERSTYVLVTNVVLIVLFWQWRPIPEMVWSTRSDLVATILIVLFWTGWGMAAISTFLTDHFDLFGMRQVVLHFKRKEYTPVPLKNAGFYKYIRHPLMVGFMMAFWATPDMSIGHLEFAFITTIYILFAIQLEEKDLAEMHGDDYREYKRSVSMLFPLRLGMQLESGTAPGDESLASGEESVGTEN